MPDHDKRIRSEFLADILIYASALAAALIGATILLFVAAGQGRPALIACGVYAAGLVVMLTCSAAYNWAAYYGRWEEWLQRFDQSAIFLMIAGSYTPFTALHLSGAWGLVLTAMVWSVATLGIGLRFRAPRLFQSPALVLYLGLGWVGLVAIGPLNEALSASVLVLNRSKRNPLYRRRDFPTLGRTCRSGRPSGTPLLWPAQACILAVMVSLPALRERLA